MIGICSQKQTVRVVLDQCTARGAAGICGGMGESVNRLKTISTVHSLDTDLKPFSEITMETCDFYDEAGTGKKDKIHFSADEELLNNLIDNLKTIIEQQKETRSLAIKQAKKIKK
jgi:hypothetical protein